jgi:hypothetical protein
MHKTIILVLILTCGTAQSSEWVSVAKSETGKELFVDVSSMQVTDKIGRAWVKLVPARHTESGDELHSTKWVQQYLKRDAFNCDEQTSSSEVATIYYDDGTNYSTPADDLTKWRPIRPDSMESKAMEFVCARKRNEAPRAPEWIRLGNSPDKKSVAFVDVSDIDVVGSVRRAWIKTVKASHTESGAGASASKWVHEYMGRDAYNCSDRTSRVEALIIYYEDGTVDKADTKNFPTPWEPIPPETQIRSGIRFVCGWTPK